MERIRTGRIPVIRLREKEYEVAFQEIEALLHDRVGVIVMGYSPRHDYVALTGGRVLENPRTHFINIPIPPRQMELMLQAIVDKLDEETKNAAEESGGRTDAHDPPPGAGSGA